MDPKRNQGNRTETYRRQGSFDHLDSHNQPVVRQEYLRGKLNSDSLERIRKSAHKHLIESQKKLIQIIESLNSDFIKMSEYLEELFHVVNMEERFEEILLKKIQEFDIRANNKYSIELRKNIKSELVQFMKSLKESEQNIKIASQTVNLKNQRKSQNDLNKYETGSLEKPNRNSVRASTDQLQRIYVVDNLRNELNDYVRFLNFYIISNCDIVGSIICALYVSCFEYIENSTLFDKVLTKILLIFNIQDQKIAHIKANIMNFQQNPNDLIKSSMRIRGNLKLENFTHIAGIFIYDSIQKKIQFFGSEDNPFNIFILSSNNDNKILLPKVEHYYTLRDLWLFQVNNLRF